MLKIYLNNIKSYKIKTNKITECLFYLDSYYIILKD